MFADMNGDGAVSPDPVNGEVLQVDHFYPFGLRMAGLSLVPGVKNSYLFTGKELQDELSLGWIDFGARMYDAASSRWNGVDALGERYAAWSPYNYVMGSPLVLVDPEGRDTYYYDHQGNFLRYERNSQKNTIQFMDAARFNEIFVSYQITPLAPGQGKNPDNLSKELTDAADFFVGANTAERLRNFYTSSQNDPQKLESGGFLYYTSGSKELQLYNCQECKERTQVRRKAAGISNPMIDLTEYNKPLPSDWIIVASWHTHPSGGGVMDDMPSGLGFGKGGDFQAGANFWKNNQLSALNGGPGVISYKGGILLYQHDERTVSSTWNYASREYRVFPFSWFNQRTGVKQVTVVVQALLQNFYKE